MDLSSLNKHFDTTNRGRGFKSANKFFNILMLVVIAICMLAVWGDVCDSYIAYSYYETDSWFSNTIYVGIESYVYSGWKHLSCLNAGLGNYIAFGLLIVFFLLATIVTYVFGIKAFVKGLRNIANHEDISIYPYFIIISLVNYAYFNFGTPLAVGALELTYVSVGWGSWLAGFVLIPSSIGILIYNLVCSFNKEKIPTFIGNLFLAVGMFLSFGIISYCISGYFGSIVDYEYRIIETFMIAFNRSYSSSALATYIIQGVVQIITILVAFYVIIQTYLVIVSDKPYNNRLYLIAPIALLVLVSFSLFSNAYAQELIAGPNADITVSSNVIGAFICSIILLTICATNYYMEKTK